MFTTDYVFVPKTPTSKAKEKVLDAVERLLGGLAKNGQLFGDPILTWINGQLRVTCSVRRPDSLAIEYFSEWARRDYSKLLVLLAEEPQYRVLDDGPFLHRMAGSQDTLFIHKLYGQHFSSLFRQQWEAHSLLYAAINRQPEGRHFFSGSATIRRWTICG